MSLVDWDDPNVERYRENFAIGLYDARPVTHCVTCELVKTGPGFPRCECPREDRHEQA